MSPLNGGQKVIYRCRRQAAPTSEVTSDEPCFWLDQFYPTVSSEVAVHSGYDDLLVDDIIASGPLNEMENVA